MSVTLRYISFVILLVLLIAFIGVPLYLRETIKHDIVAQHATETNQLLIQWYKSYRFGWDVYYKAGIRNLPCKTGNCANLQPFTNSLRENADKFFNNTPIKYYDFFLPNGENILRPQNRFITDDDDVRQAFLSAQLGNAKSVFAENFILNNAPRAVIVTFYPFISEGEFKPKGSVEGIIQVVYDVTDEWKLPDQLMKMSIPVLVVLLFVFYGVLLYANKQAEKIISKQHEIELDLTTAKTSAEEDSAAKSRFLANISHELRTPLNAIIGFSEILKDEALGPLGNEQYKDYIKDIHSSGVHLLSLINDILDYSKAEAGKLEVDLNDVDITKVMRASLRLVMPRAQEAKVQLVEKIPEEHLVVRTDAKRLKQVLLNLLSNSVKFTPEGGKVTLLSWSNVQTGTLVIEVQDTGIGIKAKDISKVMATFGQVESKLSRRYEGTGLGLPLSKKLIELMGGTFDIRSKEGVGTTVSITLPQFDPAEKKTTIT